MDDTRGTRLLVACYIVALSINVWQDLKAGNKPPRPQPIAGTGLAFALLALASPLISERLAGTLAVGLLLGLIYLHTQHSGGTQTVSALIGAAPKTPGAVSATPTQTV